MTSDAPTLLMCNTISIHTLHTEGDNFVTNQKVITFISIHTLHTEGDGEWVFSEDFVSGISIHTLHTEGDVNRHDLRFFCFDFNPHPPHGG